MINYRLLNQFPVGKRVLLESTFSNNPVPSKPIVTQKDAKAGFLHRYFVRPINDISLITEVDEKQFENFKKNPRFIATKLKWKIVGRKKTRTINSSIIDFGVEDYNRKITSDADLTFGGLMLYISDYLEYWLNE